ncbi:MAG: TIGR03013 family XrtA/PEP-CTERM system glycosyltransferase [Thiotrichales bacterium]
MKSVSIFKEQVPGRHIVLAALESLVLVASFYFGVVLRFMDSFESWRFMNLSHIEDLTGPLMPKAILFASVMLLSLMSMGLYSVRSLALKKGGIYLRVALSHIVGIVLYILVIYAMPTFFLGRGALFMAMFASLALLLLVRMTYMRLIRHHIPNKRVLVYGSGMRAANVEALMPALEQHGFSIVSFVPVAGEPEAVDAGNVVTPDMPLAQYARRQGINEIVIAVDDRRHGLPIDDLLDCRLSGIDVLELPSFFEETEGKVRLDLLTPSWLIFEEGFGRSWLGNALERVFDILASSILLLLTWPVMVLASVAIKLEEGWNAPVFYRQVRVGKSGADFEILKFRSMRVDAEKGRAPQWASKDDDRITRVGKIIRKLRIDELPQLLNVLIGHMSFVGPRPERPEFVRTLAQKIPYYNERHRVKPGITGWAQINYPYGASDRDAMEKLQYDLYYTKNHSLMFDLYILLQTVEVVLFGKGAH